MCSLCLSIDFLHLQTVGEEDTEQMVVVFNVICTTLSLFFCLSDQLSLSLFFNTPHFPFLSVCLSVSQSGSFSMYHTLSLSRSICLNQWMSVRLSLSLSLFLSLPLPPNLPPFHLHTAALFAKMGKANREQKVGTFNSWLSCLHSNHTQQKQDTWPLQ